MDQLVANTHFASSLVRFGICDQDRADQLAQESAKRWKPLGKILIDQKKLSIRDSVAIFSEQIEQPFKLFGELGVELRLCSQADVDEAIVIQRRQCPHVIELAIGEAAIDNAQLLDAAADYIRYAERLIAQLDAAGAKRRH